MCTKHLVQFIPYNITVSSTVPRAEGGGTIMAYTEELFPLQKGTFFRLQVHEREGFFIAEVYERDICYFSLLKDQNEITDTSYGCDRQETCFSDLFIL